MIESSAFHSFPQLDELCIRAVERNIDFVSQSAQQIQLLSLLPDEVRTKIFEYFIDIGKVNDEVVSLFMPAVGSDVQLSDYVRISDAALATVADRFGHQLTKLNVSGCFHLTDVGMTVISSACPSLTNLNISGCVSISSAGIEFLADKCTLLQELDTSDCGLMDDTAFYHMTRMPSLSILNLAECNRLQFDLSPTASPRAEYWSTLRKESLLSLCVRSISTITDLALLRLVRMFPKLRILDCSFSGGRVTDRGVEAISLSELPASLFSLNLWGAKITDRAINHLALTCTNLRTLTIADGGGLTESSMLLLISKVRGLKTLTMWGCTNISAASIQLFLKYFPDLTSLGLNYCSQLQDHALKGLSSSTGLRNIELESCYSITDEGLDGLGGANVAAVNLRGCTKLTSAGVSGVTQRCPNLCSLSLCRLLLDDIDIRSILLNCSSLCRLNISGIASLSVATLMSVLENGLANRLQQIKLDGCPAISDEVVQYMINNCPHLTDFSANLCQQLSGKAILVTLPFFSRRVLPLKKISFSGCVGMSCRAFCELVRCCPKLTHLSVALISDLDDLLLATLEKSCPALEAVTASRSSRITAAGIRRLVSGCMGIKQLDISNCSNLTDNGLVHIAKLGPTLRHLDISNCPMISDAAVLEMMVHTRDLQTLTIKSALERNRFPETFFEEVAKLRPNLRVIKNY